MFKFILVGLVLSALNGAAGEQPFAWDWSRAHESVVDLSRFLDPEAMQQGYVTVRAGHFATPDGKRLRLWGVNIASSSCFPPKEQAPRIADDLARFGFNIARFHHLDADWGQCVFVSNTNNTRVFDTNNLDRLDYFVAELKKRGIYVSFTMNVHRKFKEGDGVRDWHLLGIGKGATFFNSRLIELQREFTRNFLTHRNPYTGNEYRHEPSVLSIELLNENSLLEAWCQWRLAGRDDKSGDTWSPIPVSYADELTSIYNDWLRTHRSVEELATLRSEAGVASGAMVPRLAPNQFTNASALRFRGEAQFLMNVESNYFAGMRRLIRDELGSKSLLFGSADHNDGFAAFGHMQNMMPFDIMDGHGYWEHPDIGKVTRIKNNPMVNDPLDSTIVQFARTPVVGKPFTISEVNHPWPHNYAAEGYVLLTAYALLHDWDGVIWFDWERGRMADPSLGLQPHGWFDVSQDPVKLAQLTVAGLMWHQQDIAKAKQTHVRFYSPEEIVEAMRLTSWKHRPYFKPSFDLTAPLRHATRWNVANSRPPRFEGDSSNVKRVPPPLIESDTGELKWIAADRKQGVVTINGARSQSIVGFVNNPEISLPYLALEVTNRFAVVSLVALDGVTVAKSSRLLLVATGGSSSNTGQQFADDGQTLSEWGSGPVRIQPVQARVMLKNLAGATGIKAQPLTAEGRPMGEPFDARRNGDAFELTLGTALTTWHLMDVQRQGVSQ